MEWPPLHPLPRRLFRPYLVSVLNQGKLLGSRSLPRVKLTVENPSRENPLTVFMGGKRMAKKVSPQETQASVCQATLQSRPSAIVLTRLTWHD